MTARNKMPPVYCLANPSRCYGCDTRLLAGSIVKLQNKEDDREVLCLSCAGLEEYEMLPAGNAKLTKLASKHCPNHYVVLRWSEIWKCYERQGLLVEKAALQNLKQDMAAD